jgi:putative nucleotidyltransferase with HDIG domain
MPATFATLQRVLADPKTDSSKVAAIVQKDPAISAKVLQACNSAFFRLPRRVASIQQAVSYLGLSTVRSMVLSVELFKPGKALCGGLDLGQLQRHALNVAAVARSLAAETAWAEDAFLAGLLHDIGFLILGRQHGVEMQQALQAHAAGTPLEDAERQFVGVDHGTAGAYLLGLWGLPYEVVEAVANHSAPERTARISFDVLSAVGIAHALVLTVRPQDVPIFDGRMPVLGDGYLRAIGRPDSWESLVDLASSLLNTEQTA